MLFANTEDRDKRNLPPNHSGSGNQVPQAESNFSQVPFYSLSALSLSPSPPGHASLASENKRTINVLTDDALPSADEDCEIFISSTLPPGTAGANNEAEGSAPEAAKRNKKHKKDIGNGFSNNGGANQPSRTIYLGGVTPDITANDLLTSIKGGQIEAVRFLTEKSCTFIDFCSVEGAQCFWKRLNHTKRVLVRGRDIRVAWAKPTPVAENVATAVKNGASRCIFFGDFEETEVGHTAALEAAIRKDLGKFGMIDCIKVVPERSCVFAHMTNISDAMKAVAMLSAEDRWKGKRISFGRDRCALPESREEGQILEEHALTRGVPRKALRLTDELPMRTVYLGGVPSQAKPEELCNVIRGGMLEKIRLTLEKRCAFITFIEPDSAEAFYQFALNHGIVLHGQRLKPGRGPPCVMPGAVISALRQGATRNLYLGGLQTHAVTEEDLHEALSPFGQIEMINFLKRDHTRRNHSDVAFINYCNILDAVKAFEGIRRNPLFANCNVAYGKDRCAQPIKAPIPIIPMNSVIVPTSPVPIGFVPLVSNPISPAAGAPYPMQFQAGYPLQSAYPPSAPYSYFYASPSTLHPYPLYNSHPLYPHPNFIHPSHAVNTNNLRPWNSEEGQNNQYNASNQ